VRSLALAAALIGAGGMLSGCGKNLTPEELGPPVDVVTVEQDQQQTLRFEVVPNEVRVDVIRQTHEEEDCTTDTDSDGNETENCTTETVNDPYQPVGVYLGHGLFLDADLNLSVVPDRVFHEPLVPQDFHNMQIQGPFGNWTKYHITQEGPQVGISQSLAFFDNEVVRDNPDQTTMKFGTFKSLQKFNNIVIIRNGDEIDIQAWAPKIKLLQDMQRISITTHGNTVTVHPFGIKKFVDTNITYSGDTVTVQPFGGHFTRTDISKGPGEEIHINHWGIGKEMTERGQTGLNESGTALKLTMRDNVQIQGNQYHINDPGPFGKSVITVEP